MAGLLVCAFLTIFAQSAAAGQIELRAKGAGDNGTTFKIKAKYQLNNQREEAEFKIKNGIPGHAYTVRFSTDGCTFSFEMTPNAQRKANVESDSEDGNFPPGFPSLAAGDELIVNGVSVGVFRNDD